MLLRGIAELLSQTRCCGCELPGSLLCPSCEVALPRIEPSDACPRCGAPAPDGACRECYGRAFAFTAARCAGLLAPPLSRLVVMYKDAGERRLAGVLGALAAEALASAEWDRCHDAVAHVPASRAALLRRGFDHASDVADVVAALIGAPRTSSLARVGRGDQRRLGREARLAAMGSAFHAGPEQPTGSVLLVDDVFTTGSTLNAASAVLLETGATEVRVLTVARACDARG